MKSICVLGSSGSIGRQALEVIEANPKEFRVSYLSVKNNIGLLEKQIKKFRPKAVAVADLEKADELESKGIVAVYKGTDGLNRLAKEKSDLVLNSVVGTVGIEPTYEAIRAKNNVALANKESLVSAGSVIMKEAKKNNVSIIPVDSEHSAIFQCIRDEHKNAKKIILTCSGGPFRNKTLAEMKKATPKEALKHPTWNMGAKITIDSATLMNKGFEVLEAHWLYSVPFDKIDVVIHPQSIVHSLVEFNDTSLLAQLGLPNMKIPIQYALSYPERLKANHESLDLAKVSNLEFSSPDFKRFPCLKYAYDSAEKGGLVPAAMNAANDVAVERFLTGNIGFLDIPKIISKAMSESAIIKNPGIKDILEQDKKTKASI